jgi:hypothetical protein
VQFHLALALIPTAALQHVADSTPLWTVLTVELAGLTLRANIATRSLRRAVAAIRDHGVDGLTLTLQGDLTGSGVLEEARLAVQPKAKPAEQPAASLAA